VRSIAFPAISCGVYGYPVDQACEISVRETKSFLQSHTALRVLFVAFGKDVYDTWRMFI